jgi:hypothetical protein
LGRIPNHSHNRGLVQQPVRSHPQQRKTLPFDSRTPRLFRTSLVLLGSFRVLINYIIITFIIHPIIF